MLGKKKKKKKKKETAVHRLTMADLNCWYITQSRLSSQSTSNQCHRLSTTGLPTAALSEAGLGWLTDKTRRGVNFFEFFLPGQTPGKKKKKKKKRRRRRKKKLWTIESVAVMSVRRQNGVQEGWISFYTSLGTYREAERITYIGTDCARFFALLSIRNAVTAE